MTTSSIDGAPSRLRIETLNGGEATCLGLAGEADMASLDELRRRLGTVQPDAVEAVRLDLTELRFADAATVAELGAFALAVRSHDHPVLTCGASALFAEVADVLGCSQALGLGETAESP